MKKGHIKKSSVALSLFILIVILVTSLFAFKNVFTKNPDDNPIELNKDKERTYSLSLAMVGDVLIHGSLYQDAMVEPNKYDFKYMFDEMKPLLKNYDLKIYNQESIIGGKSLGLSTYPRFNSPEEIGDAMIDLGFNVVSLANNHTLDKGETGVTNSINYWKTKGIMFSGSALSEEERIKDNIKEKNGISYTMLSYTTSTNGIPVPSGKGYLVNVYDKEKAKQDIERVKDKTDIIIVSIHWGNEYSNEISSQQKEIATYLSSLGVNIIVGHHPHVIEPIEQIGNTIVFYSLGNFISAQDTIDRLTGLVASVNISVTKSKDTKTVSYNQLKAELIYTTHQSYSNFKLVPFSKITTKELPSYRSVYDKYCGIIKKLNNSITITELGDR